MQTLSGSPFSCAGNTIPMHDSARALSTSQSEANELLLEMIRQGNRTAILLWLQTPQSSALLSKCEAAKVTPFQVANPETLLPRAAIACLRLSEWLQLLARRFGQDKAKYSARFSAALSIQEAAVKENQPLVQHALTKSQVQ